MKTSRWDMQAFLHFSGVDFLNRAQSTAVLLIAESMKNQCQLKKKKCQKKYIILKNEEYIISWINVVFLDGLGDVCLNRKFVLNIVLALRECDLTVFHLSLSSIMCSIYELEMPFRDYNGTQALTPTPLCHGTR